MTIKRRINRVIFYLAVILVCIVVATPFVIMISYSLRSTQEIFSLSQSIIPANVTLEAYRNALYDYSYSGVGFGTWSINSIWVCGIATFLAIFFSAITTGVSFGILMISDTKALNSFGEVIFSGMGCILLLLFLAKIQRKI